TLESRKGERFWPLLDTLSTLPPVCVGGSFCRDRARPGAWSAGESQAAWRGTDLPDLRPAGSARTRGGGCGMRLCVSSCCLPYLALSPKIWSQNSSLEAPPQGHLGFWFDPAHGQVKDYWQRQREEWNLSHAFRHPERNQAHENPSCLDGLPGTGLPSGAPGGGRLWGARGSRQPGDGAQAPAAPTRTLPDSLAPRRTRAGRGPSGRREPSGSRGAATRLPGASPAPRGRRRRRAAPPHPGRDPRTGKPESWLPAGPGPRRPAIPRPERRTGSRTRWLSAWGWGGTSRLTPCLSPAPFSPFLPPRDGSPRARRKPGSSQRPPSGRTTPAPAGSLQRDAAKEHYINTLGPDLDTEDSCFKKIQSSLKSCNLYAF
ncbi:hypothetical protein EI555_006086, partial [Monodon monoceros]